MSALNHQAPAETTADTPEVKAAAPRKQAADGAARAKLQYYATEAENARIRAAFSAGRVAYGWMTLTEFQLEAVMARVEQVEAELNNGQPFDADAPRDVPRGRPIS